MTDQAVPAPPRSTRVRLPVIGPLLFACILTGYLLSFNVDKPTHNADWYIRYEVTCQIVEHNVFNIHPYRQDARTGPGLDGTTYAQYTLGQTTAMIPFYLLGRVLAGLPHTDCAKTIAPPIVFLTAKTLDLVVGALLCVLFFATARRIGYGRGVALTLTLLLAFGSALWPDVLSNLEHTMESLFLLAGAYAALRYTLAAQPNRRWLLVMGLAAGLVFVTRVAGSIVLVIFALYLLVLHRRRTPQRWWAPLRRDLLLYAAGVAPSIAVNLFFNMLRFGKPTQFQPYGDQSFGYLPWFGIPNLLVSPGKGLIWYVPALLLLPLAIGAFRRRLPLPTALFALIVGLYLLFYANVRYWHGDPAWGPRYLYAVLPYLLLPLGEVVRRWRSYRLPLRGVVVVVLAASFLVQFSAVTVSYWRHWSYIYAYHGDQVENHSWGQNLNYWWIPDESPIVISLAGLADIAQKTADGAQLLAHPIEQRLSNPYETCYYQLYKQASICLTPSDDLHYNADWNTFTPWWFHTYPWWDRATVTRIALALLAVFLLSGGALVVVIVRSIERRPGADRRLAVLTRVPLPLEGGNGHNPHIGEATVHDTYQALVPLDLASRPPAPAEAGGVPTGAVAVVVAPALQTEAAATIVAAPPYQREHPSSGLVPLGLAVLLALSAYASIVVVAVARAPHAAPPLIRTYALGATVRDATWSYRVTGVDSLANLPGELTSPPTGHHYAIVHLQLSNSLTRPNTMPGGPDSFGLTDTDGFKYPRQKDLNEVVAALYHLAPFGAQVPAHGTLDGALIFLVRDGPHHLDLLGPGIALVRLT